MYTLEDKVRTLLNELDNSLFNMVKLTMTSGFKKNSKCDATLSDRQLHILYVIKKHNINTTSGIADFFNLSKANISIIVSKLEANGHLIKEQSKDNKDGRNVFLKITEKGLNDLDIYSDILRKNIHDNIGAVLDKEHQIKLFQCAFTLSKLINTEFDLSDSFESILVLFLSVDKYLEKIVDRSVKNAGLNLSNNELKLLKLLNYSNNTIDTISEATGISNSAISTQISVLLDKGYVDKVIDTKDKRKKFFYVKEEKMKELDSILQYNIENIINDIKKVDVENQKIICDMIEDILCIINNTIKNLEVKN
ncbi:MAG: MarR family transcriptional regulator [Lachnospirales bacterium]